MGCSMVINLYHWSAGNPARINGYWGTVDPLAAISKCSRTDSNAWASEIRSKLRTERRCIFLMERWVSCLSTDVHQGVSQSYEPKILVIGTSMGNGQEYSLSKKSVVGKFGSLSLCNRVPRINVFNNPIRTLWCGVAKVHRDRTR